MFRQKPLLNKSVKIYNKHNWLIIRKYEVNQNLDVEKYYNIYR